MDYSDMLVDYSQITLPLSSADGLFTSLQGEGPNVGKKAVFVRMMGCSLECHWTSKEGIDSWCDSAYTWKPSLMVKSDVKSVQDILNYAEKSKPVETVVLTGGEPMIQKNLPLLAQILTQAGYLVEIETSGTIKPIESIGPEPMRWLHYNVSPKLSSSNNSLEKRYKPEVIKEFLEGWAAGKLSIMFKFVVTSEQDFIEIKSDWEEKLSIPRRLISVMPAVTESEAHIKVLPWLWDMCKQYDYKLAARLHVLSFGAKVGI